ncbi:MAG: S4 domain-containing protein [Candidatus Latescibacterota bacterium]
MRIDLYLSRCGLLKHRSLAKRACDNGIVLLSGARAKPGKEVHVGQQIAIQFRDHPLKIEVLQIPGRSVPKRETQEFYQVLDDPTQ